MIEGVTTIGEHSSQVLDASQILFGTFPPYRAMSLPYIFITLIIFLVSVFFSQFILVVLIREVIRVRYTPQCPCKMVSCIPFFERLRIDLNLISDPFNIALRNVFFFLLPLEQMLLYLTNFAALISNLCSDLSQHVKFLSFTTLLYGTPVKLLDQLTPV